MWRALLAGGRGDRSDTWFTIRMPETSGETETERFEEAEESL